ncbi:hypothetical protein HPB50_002666 [Hyalomma asiaticum]|uniref:Uncharacterized protein n=1 Tax=Hyalomma asiaticum TaxID=266040 RepID=A0ACB7SMH8_HYAAI|nr:hypothetical protein HPB50_002666 [Hyalomma asiaticum]
MSSKKSPRSKKSAPNSSGTASPTTSLTPPASTQDSPTAEKSSPEFSQIRMSRSPHPVGLDASESANVQRNVYTILGHGAVQRRVLAATVLSMVALFFHTLALRLVGRSVDHWCRPPDDLRDMPPHEWKNVAIPIEADGSYSRCTVYVPPLPVAPEEERRVIRCERWDYDIANIQDSIVSSYDLVCDRRWLYHVSSLVYMVGAMPFAPFAGVLSDKRGRKPVIMATVIALLLASLSVVAADTFILFLIARFFVCAASSSSTLILFTLLYEVTGDEWRATYIVWATGLAAIFCPPFLALVALLEPRWILAQGVIVTPTLALLAWCLLLDESPSWLLATCRLHSAERVLFAAARANHQDEDHVKATYLVLKEQVKRHEQVNEPNSKVGSRGTSVYSTVIKQEHTVPVLLCWFTLNFGYYAIELSSQAPGTVWDQAAHLLLQLALYLRTARLVVRWGYRGTLTMLLGMLCVCVPVHVVAMFQESTMLVSLCDILVACGCAAAMSVTYGYTTEVFPTTIRASGLCLSYSSDRLGGLLAVASLAATTRDAGLAIDAAAATMIFLCLAVVRWLPEVFLARKSLQQVYKTPTRCVRIEDRKEAMKRKARARSPTIASR